jgi:chromate transporter
VTDLLWLTWTFLWLSLLCVGGGIGVIPEMQRQVVLNHQWVTAREFVDGYTLAQLTPGPNMLFAAFVGYRAHGLAGAVLATVAMFLPTSLLAVVAADRWRHWRGRPWAQAVERALAPAWGSWRPASTRSPARRCTTSSPSPSRSAPPSCSPAARCPRCS